MLFLIKWFITSSFILFSLAFGNASSYKIVASGIIRISTRKHIVSYVTFTDEIANFVASNFNVVIADFSAKESLNKIKAINPNVILLGYRNIMAMHPHYEDWEEVNAHEEWFLHDINGNRLINKKYGWYAMDVGSTGWQNHYANFVKAKLDMYPVVDGLFADDVWEWTKYQNMAWTVEPSLVPPEIQYRWHNDMVRMIQYVKSILGSKLVIINTNELTGDYLKYVDGMMFENFIHGCTEGLDEFSADPISHVKQLINLSSTGKYFLAHSGAKIPQNHTQDDLEKAHKVMLYSFCSYLLGLNGPLASFGWNTIKSEDGSRGYYAEMDYDIGFPLGNYYIKDGLYMRDFERVRVLVNFSAEARSTVVEGKTYTLEPRSGIIVKR